MPRYQNGTIEEVKTTAGATWFIRFTAPDGSRPRTLIGMKSAYPTKAKAYRAAQPLRERFNGSPATVLSAIRTFGDVVARYELEEMPARHSTQRGYRNLHRVHILPRWAKTSISEVSAMAVREWILGLDLATRTRGHIHGQMRVLFRFAMLWGWTPVQANPMALFTVPGATKRARPPQIVDPGQFRAMLEPETRLDRRAMLIASYCLGLRVSELMALRWDDFDHLERTVTISRAIVEGKVGEVKTERSGAALPLPKFVADAFLRWRAQTPDTSGWVFLGQRGKQPPNVTWLQFHWLRPMGERAGLLFPLGWHTFRHSFKTLLVNAGIDVTIQRDLMRHADVHTTMQTYGANNLQPLRDASDRAIEALFL